MKNLILVAVILQLVITIKEINGDYKFGDIIVFPRKCICKKIPLLKHYAIYVGPKRDGGIDVGQGDNNDIFHRIGKKGGPFDCQFGQLEMERKKQTSNDEKDNYLDNIDDFKPGTTDDIKGRITEELGQCAEKYKSKSNNCEHLATYVRYGHGASVQHGTIGSSFVKKNLSADTIKKIKERIKNDEEEEEADCTSVCDVPS